LVFWRGGGLTQGFISLNGMATVIRHFNFS
jgi:hypothetical protein